MRRCIYLLRVAESCILPQDVASYLSIFYDKALY